MKRFFLWLWARFGDLVCPCTIHMGYLGYAPHENQRHEPWQTRFVRIDNKPDWKYEDLKGQRVRFKGKVGTIMAATPLQVFVVWDNQ